MAWSFFKLMTSLMKNNPPASADPPKAAMAMIGIVPGQDFDVRKLEPSVAAHSVSQDRATEYRSLRKGGQRGERMGIFRKTGLYGTDYLQRATITLYGLGANLPQDAVYPASELTAEGTPYSGANKYVIHFGKDDHFRRSRASGR